MSKSEVKVREFWIDPDSDDDDMSTFIAFRRHPRQGDLEWQESLVHVIEYSYATRLEEENKKLREALRTKCMCYPSDDPRSGRNPCHACRTIQSWQDFLNEEGV